VGDALFKSRSDELRRRVDQMVGVPVDARLRPMTPVLAEISAAALDDGGMRLGIIIGRGGEVIADGSVILETADERQKGDLISDLKDVFHLFGDQGVYVEEFTFILDKNFFVPKSKLKELKRQVEQGLAEAATNVCLRHMDDALAAINLDVASLPAAAIARYTLKIDRVEYLPWIQRLIKDGARVTEVIFEPKKMFLPDVKPESFLSKLNEFKSATGLNIRLAVPTVVRAWDEPVLKVWFKAALDAGVHAFEVGNPGAIGLLKEWGMPLTDLSADFTIYGMNREAIKHWQGEGIKEIALSIEDDAEDIGSLLEHWPAGIKPQAILYKDTPLFVAEACSLTALHNGCPSSKVCGYRTLEVENSKGERFFVAHEGCKSIVYGKDAYAISGERRRLMDFGVESFRIDFLTRDYDEQALSGIVMAASRDEKIPGTHTANFPGRLK
jgi:putative protease